MKKNLLELAKNLGIHVKDGMNEEELLKLIKEKKDEKEKEIQKQNDEAAIINSILMW